MLHVIDFDETVSFTWEEACERANDVPTDCEEKEREEDAKAASSHLNIVRKSTRF